MMVERATDAGHRSFSVLQMLQASKAYNIRRATRDVARRLMRHANCSNANVHVAMQGKSMAQIRRELNSSLARSLQAGLQEAAFAKACAMDERPRADELERMVVSNPAEIDWDCGNGTVRHQCSTVESVARTSLHQVYADEDAFTMLF